MKGIPRRVIVLEDEIEAGGIADVETEVDEPT